MCWDASKSERVAPSQGRGPSARPALICTRGLQVQPTQKGTIKLSPAQAKFLADRPEDCVSEHLMEEFFGYEPEEGYTARTAPAMRRCYQQGLRLLR